MEKKKNGGIGKVLSAVHGAVKGPSFTYKKSSRNRLLILGLATMNFMVGGALMLSVVRQLCCFLPGELPYELAMASTGWLVYFGLV